MAATVAEAAAADRLLTEDVALVDRSERGKLALTGPQAKELLSGQVTNDIEALTPGSGCYAALLTNKGKMLADLRVLDTADELWLDTERVALQALFDTLRRGAVGWQAELHKRTLQQALLSLVGPHAARGRGRRARPRARQPPRAARRRRRAARRHRPRASTSSAPPRTPSASAAPSTSPSCPRPPPRSCASSPGARATASTSTTRTIPQEAGLNERAVSFTKGCYVGQETVARLHYKGKPNRHLRGLRFSAPVPTGTPLVLGEREVGRVGSSVVSPRFGPIGLALVRREAAVGDELVAGSAVAVVAELPF